MDFPKEDFKVLLNALEEGISTFSRPEEACAWSILLCFTQRGFVVERIPQEDGIPSSEESNCLSVLRSSSISWNAQKGIFVFELIHHDLEDGILVKCISFSQKQMLCHVKKRRSSDLMTARFEMNFDFIGSKKSGKFDLSQAERALSEIMDVLDHSIFQKMEIGLNPLISLELQEIRELFTSAIRKMTQPPKSKAELVVVGIYVICYHAGLVPLHESDVLPAAKQLFMPDGWNSHAGVFKLDCQLGYGIDSTKGRFKINIVELCGHLFVSAMPFMANALSVKWKLKLNNFVKNLPQGLEFYDLRSFSCFLDFVKLIQNGLVKRLVSPYGYRNEKKPELLNCPSYLLLEFLSYLDPKSLVQSGNACTTLSYLSRSPLLWKVNYIFSENWLFLKLTII